MQKNRPSSIFLTQVAAFLTACSGNGSLLGLGGNKERDQSQPPASSVIEDKLSDETKKLIFEADPATRDEFVLLMDALRVNEHRESIQKDTQQSLGIIELAFMLDDDEFVDYVADFTEKYSELKANTGGSQEALIRTGQEISEFMQDNYPAAVETLKEYAERFPPDDEVIAKIESIRDTILSSKTANHIDSDTVTGLRSVDLALAFPLQQTSSDGDKGANTNIGSTVVNSAVGGESYTNVAGVTNAVAVTNAAVVAEVFVYIVVSS